MRFADFIDQSSKTKMIKRRVIGAIVCVLKFGFRSIKLPSVFGLNRSGTTSVLLFNIILIIRKIYFELRSALPLNTPLRSLGFAS